MVTASRGHCTRDDRLDLLPKTTPGNDVDRNTIDARSARIAIAMYLRWWFLPLIALAVGFLVGGMLSTESTEQSESSATMVIGLTEEVRWPFFDAVLARQEGLITENDLPTRASANTGIEHISVEITSSNVQNSTLEVGVTVNGTAEDAAVFADELGQLLVETNLEDRRSSFVTTASGLESEIADIQTEAAAMSAELEALNEQWVSIQDQIIVSDPEDIPTLQGQATAVDNERRILQRRIDSVIGLETSLATQLAQARINENQTGNPIEVSSNAIAGTTEATDLRPIIAVLFFLVSLIVVPFLERRFGRVRSIDHLATIWPGARVVDARNRRLSKATINPIDVARLAARAEGETDTVAIAALADTSVANMMVAALEADDAETSLIDLSSAHDMERVVSADKLAIVVPSGRVPLRRAERVADNLNTLSADPMVVLLASRTNSKTITSYVDHLTNTTAADTYTDILSNGDDADLGAEELLDDDVVAEDPELGTVNDRWGGAEVVSIRENESDSDEDIEEDADDELAVDSDQDRDDSDDLEDRDRDDEDRDSDDEEDAETDGEEDVAAELDEDDHEDEDEEDVAAELDDEDTEDDLEDEDDEIEEDEAA